MSNKFTADHDVTVGVDFGSYLIRVEDVLYKLQILRDVSNFAN